MRHEAMCYIPEVEVCPEFVRGADVYQHGDIITMTPTSSPPDILITAVRYLGHAPFMILRQRNGDSHVLVQEIGMEGVMQLFEDEGFLLYDASTQQQLSPETIDQSVKQQLVLRVKLLQ